MNLKFQIELTDIDENISDHKISELLHDIKYRLEGYSTTPPEDINYENMSIKYIKGESILG